MRQFFGSFGEIKECVIMVDRSLMPRGFGFVTFKERDAIERVFSQKTHEVDGKIVECKIAVPKAE